MPRATTRAASAAARDRRSRDVLLDSGRDPHSTTSRHRGAVVAADATRQPLVADINALVADARRRLRAAGIPPDEAALDARLLAQHVLGWDAAGLLTHGDQQPPPAIPLAFEALVARRVAREPLAYITGVREFWNLIIEVSPAVLVPRPETELLIEAALDRFERDRRLRFADVCTGSGCVAVALGREFPRADIVATDIIDETLQVARRNVARHGLSGRVQCTRTDLLAAVRGPFDAIFANPPYVPSIDAPTLQPEVRQFEPPAALFAGDDGLRIIKRLVVEALPALASDGLLLFEFGAGQESAVSTLIEHTRGLELLEMRRDLQNIPRTAVARRM
jgi:release factor glutamine methyltransferase